MNSDKSNPMCLESALQQQVEWLRLVMAIATRIRQSLNLDEVLNITVTEVRQFLRADRVFMYRFDPDYSGAVVVESVDKGWKSILNAQVQDTYFMETKGEEYRQGRIQVVEDIYIAGLTECHCNLLAQFEVRANLAIPILQGEKLWGLLVANQCAAPRQWQKWEIDLLEQLATQVGIAIQQSQLYEQVQSELAERKRAEEALQQSENLYRQLVENQSDVIVRTDLQGRLTFANQAACQTFGLQSDELRGQSLFEFFYPDDLPQTMKNMKVLAFPPHRLFVNEQRALTVNGIRWFQWNVTTITDELGEVIETQGVGRDITERKQAEQKIKEQAALLDITTDAILVKDFSGQILFWNQGAERLYGWQADEILGHNAEELLYKETSPLLIAALQDVIERGSWQGELDTVTKSGQSIIVESRWTLMRDEASQPKSILSVDTDITEKKQLQSQFLRTQRLESLGTLASGIAHDLNNILTPIMLSSQMLAPKLTHLDARYKQMLLVIEDNSKRAADLVKQILTFSHGSQRQSVSLEIEHLLLEIEQITHSTFPKSIQIRKNLPKQKLWTIKADSTQIHQVLMNLCVNARDAMPKGGTLEISANNFFADENFARMKWDAKVGPYLVMTIKDTGFGIPPLILERIFEPFFTTKELGKGTGLGLSTAIGIVKKHGGFISVESVVGKGTQFQVYLPALKESISQQAEISLLPHGNGELILVVDDEAAILEITKTSLEDSNYRILTASNGIEAISLYAQHKNQISMVLMDIMMPDIDGLTAIGIMQQMKPQVKIIGISGIAMNNQIVASAKVDVNVCLQKPYTINQLLCVINSLLNSVIEIS
ncbi:PAS domain S-box protein [Halotia wernerae UHCC 0503]|nr:PAS domain S-box protein [Halotia wernerae UHCC 0503]